MDKKFKAFAAAQRIMNELRAIDLDFNNPFRVLDDYELCPDYIHWGYGATRIAVWDDEHDFVIKFARDVEYEKYTEAEVDLYSRAKELGIETHFAWIDKFASSYTEDDGTYMPAIYVAEFLYCDDNEVGEVAWDYGYERYCESLGLDSSDEDNMDSYNDERIDEKDEILDYFLSQMSEEDRTKTYNFIYDNDINDLHSGNYSFRGKQLVIHDYAGWGW